MLSVAQQIHQANTVQAGQPPRFAVTLAEFAARKQDGRIRQRTLFNGQGQTDRLLWARGHAQPASVAGSILEVQCGVIQRQRAIWAGVHAGAT